MPARRPFIAAHSNIFQLFFLGLPSDSTEFVFLPVLATSSCEDLRSGSRGFGVLRNRSFVDFRFTGFCYLCNNWRGIPPAVSLICVCIDASRLEGLAFRWCASVERTDFFSEAWPTYSPLLGRPMSQIVVEVARVIAELCIMLWGVLAYRLWFQGRVRTKTVKRAARQIVEKYYAK